MHAIAFIFAIVAIVLFIVDVLAPAVADGGPITSWRGRRWVALGLAVLTLAWIIQSTVGTTSPVHF